MSLDNACQKKIAFLSQYFWPEETATAELLSGIAFELAKQGYSVEGLAGQPAYRSAGQRLPWLIEKDNLRVVRVRSTQFNKNNAIGRIINTITFTLAAQAACLFRPRPDILIAVTNPPLLPWVARLTKLLRRTPYILIIHDVYPDVAIGIGRMRSGSAVSALWRMLNRWAYRGATKIVVLGECMADILHRELPETQRDKVVVIPNWADGAKIVPMPRANHELLREWKLEHKFVVQYSGNIGLFHEIETIVDAAEILKEHDDIHFLMIGDGGQLPWLLQQVRQRSLRNVSLEPFQPKERLPLSLTACDASLVTLKGEVTGFCVPSKFYGILAAGRPVIGVLNQRSETGRAIERHECGMVVRPGDSRGLADAILELRRTPEKCKAYGKAARRALDENYTLEIVARQYEKVLREALA